MKENLIVTNVSRVAFDDERVDLSSDRFNVVLHLRNPADHGSFSKDQVVGISIGGAGAKKTAGKKTSAKKTSEAKV